MERSVHVFEIPEEESPSSLLEAVASEFGGRERPVSSETVTYLDTFDGRVRVSGDELLFRRNGTGRALVWQRASLGAERTDAEAAPSFGRELPSAEPWDDLRKRVGARRLGTVVELAREARLLDVLDAEQKTVCRLRLEETRARAPETVAWTPLPASLAIEGLRGYDEEADRIERFVRFQLGLAEREGGELGLARAALGLAEPSDPLEPLERLAGDMPAGGAVRFALRALLETISRNERGTLERLDVEFLHDFRIGVRRTRAVLRELGSVFSKTARTHYLGEFRWLGRSTGPARDLDVLILELQTTSQRLEPDESMLLYPLIAAARRAAVEQHARLRSELEGGRYRNLVRNWRDFLEFPQKSELHVAAAKDLIVDRVVRRVDKRVRRVVKSGKAVTPETPAEVLHALRIDCKRLRYLLEVFRALFDRKGTRRVVKRLKGLQDCLGGFQDAQIHADFIQVLCRSPLFEPLEDKRVESTLAVGRLVQRLHDRQSFERERFAERFERFRECLPRGGFDRFAEPEEAS